MVDISRAKRPRNYVSLANAGSGCLGSFDGVGPGHGGHPGHLGNPLTQAVIEWALFWVEEDGRMVASAAVFCSVLFLSDLFSLLEIHSTAF